MDDNSTTLVVVVGYLGNEMPKSRAVIISRTRDALHARGKPFVVIGDGAHAPTLNEIRQSIAAIPGSVEVLLDAHGEKVSSEAGIPELGNYAVTLSDGRTPSAEPIGALPDGTPLNRNQVVGITDFFRAMPPNVSGVMLGSCYSEAALPYADLLPSHARLFVTSGIDSTTLGDQSYKALQALSHLSDIVPDGSSLTENYGYYLATFRNTVTYYKDVEWHGKTPSRFAISGEGTIDLAVATRQLTGYRFPDSLLNDVLARIAPNEDAATRATMASELRSMTDKITSGEVIGNQASENRAYNFIVTEMARVAATNHITMSAALQQMEAQAAQARAAVVTPQVSTTAPPEVSSVEALGQRLQGDFAHLQQGGANAQADHTSVSVPASAQAQGRPPVPQVAAASSH